MNDDSAEWMARFKASGQLRPANKGERGDGDARERVEAQQGLGVGCDALGSERRQVLGALPAPRRPHPPHPSASIFFDSEAKARFWRKVSPAPSDACWIWRGAVNSQGYGNVGRNHKTYLAHRVAYEITNGPVPDGMDLDHLCMVRLCVNPAHLEAVTFLANMRRRYAEKPDERETHCIRGHELNAENVMFVWTTGQIRCRACDRSRRAS